MEHYEENEKKQDEILVEKVTCDTYVCSVARRRLTDRKTTEKYKKKKKFPMNIELTKLDNDFTTNSNNNKTNHSSKNGGYVPPSLEKSNTKSGPTSTFKPVTSKPGNTGGNIMNKISNLPLFTCKCEYYQNAMTGDRYEFVFSISEKYPKETWKIIKTYSDFNNLQKALEKRLNRNIPFFDQYVSIDAV